MNLIYVRRKFQTMLAIISNSFFHIAKLTEHFERYLFKLYFF